MADRTGPKALRELRSEFWTSTLESLDITRVSGSLKASLERAAAKGNHVLLAQLMGSRIA